MFDVGLLKGVNVVLLRSVTVNLAKLWRASSRDNFVIGISFKKLQVASPTYLASSSEGEGPNPQSEKSKSFSLRV